jgi:hypothetical protein
LSTVRILPTLKGQGSSADAPNVADFPEISIFGLVIISAAASLGVLGTLAHAIRNQLMIDEVKRKADHLRRQYRKRLAEAEQRQIIEVGEAPAGPTAAIAA